MMIVLCVSVCIYSKCVDVDDVVIMISAGQILHLINLIVVHVCVFDRAISTTLECVLYYFTRDTFCSVLIHLMLLIT